MKGFRRGLLVALSAMVILLLGTLVASATAPSVDSYYWDGFKLVMDVDGDPTGYNLEVRYDDAVQYSTPLTAGTVECDLEPIVMGIYNQGHPNVELIIKVVKADDDNDVPFTLQDTFYMLQTEVNAGAAVDKDTELTVELDSLYLCWDPENEDFEKVAEADYENYCSWAKQTLTIKKGQSKATGLVVLNWYDTIEGTPTPYLKMPFFRLKANAVVKDSSVYSVFDTSSDFFIAHDYFQFDLAKWNDSSAKFMEGYGPLSKAAFVDGDSASYNALLAYMDGSKVSLMTFGVGANTADESNALLWVMLLMIAVVGVEVAVKVR